MIKTNPDTEFVKEMWKAIRDNSGYCPCQLEKTEDTKCMCKSFREMKEGICHCGMYIKTKD